MINTPMKNTPMINTPMINTPHDSHRFQGSFVDMKQAIMASIIELNDEMENLYGPICEQAQEHIHNNECVLVYGYSPIIELFLKAAARKRR